MPSDLPITKKSNYSLSVGNHDNRKIQDKIFPERLATIHDKLGEVMRKASKYEQALDYFTKAQNIIDINFIKNP